MQMAKVHMKCFIIIYCVIKVMRGIVQLKRNDSLSKKDLDFQQMSVSNGDVLMFSLSSVKSKVLIIDCEKWT